MMRFLRSTSVLLALLLGSACASGMDDVNRVQPNYYDKSLFTGTWYMRQTVVDVPYEAFWLNEGLHNDLAKVRWEIQEKFLFAYSVSETIPGANDPSVGAPSYQPVAAWPIISHFDIIREYNPATGEQSNVIVENQSDRPWYERQYIRVDWSNSRTISEYTFDTHLMRVRLSGANHWIQPHEETDPDAAEISEDYISIVNAFDAYVSWIECSLYFGDLGYILYFDGLQPNCGPATVRIRTSFAKIDPQEELAYEPFNYLDNKPILAPTDMNGDGVIDDEDVIDEVIVICSDVEQREDGLVCTQNSIVPCTDRAIEALNTHPFYAQFGYSKDDCQKETYDYNNKFPYFRTTKTRYTRDYGQVEESREYLINRHNIWKRSRDENGNPIPYEEREVRPIVYYLNADFPEELYETAMDIGRQWNEAFAHTVATLQGKSIDEVGTVFEVRPNSCSPDNLREYVSKNGEAKSIAQRVIGGIENLDMSNIKKLCAALQHNLGFEWQKIGDVRYNFLYWANNPTGRPLLGYGPSSANPDTGEIVSSGAYVYGATVDLSAGVATDVVLLLTGRLSESELRRGKQFLESVRRARQLDKERREQRPSEEFFRELDRRMSSFRELPFERTTPSVSPEHFDAKLARLRELGVDKIFMNEPTLSLLRPDYRPGMDYEDYEKLAAEVSIFDLISPKKVEERRHAEIAKAMHGCMLEADMVDDSIIGLALEFDGRGMSREEIFQELRKEIFKNVMLHEIGHTLGLRHNFAGSMDALNYFDKFWEYLELPEDPSEAVSRVSSQEEAERLNRCIERSREIGIPTPTTMQCLRASELKEASVMDYSAKFNAGFRGLGKYDKAAVAFGYGNLIEVFANEEAVKNLPFPPATTSFITHYKRYPEVFGGAENFLDRKWVRYDEYQRERSYHMLMRQNALPRMGQDPDDENNVRCIENCDETIEIQVPYESCIDEFQGRSLTCHVRDEGGSHEEVIDSIINTYESYYFLRAFRRGRTGWTATGYLNALDRDLTRGTRMFQYYYFYNHRWRELFNAGWELDVVRDLQVASVKALNHIARILQTPADGLHCMSPEGYYVRYEQRSEDCAPDSEIFDIPLGVGRPQWQLYNDDYPHYQIESLGSYFERFMALRALTLNQSLFLQESGDPRTFLIGFNKAFEDEVVNLIGAVALGDLGAYAGYLDQSQGVPDFRPRPLIDLETFGLLPAPSDTMPKLAPPFSYEGREAALLFGMVFLNDTRDAMTEFRDYFTMVQKGSDEDFEIPDWVETDDPEQYIEFVNPFNGTTYRSFANPRNPSLSFGMKTLREAKEFHDNEWLPAYKNYEAAKTAYEDGLLDPDEAYEALEAADAELRAANFKMNERIELIDRVRFWYKITKLGM